MDLGVLFDQRLHFNLHFELVINKARAAFGFIELWSEQVDDPYVTKCL